MTDHTMKTFVGFTPSYVLQNAANQAATARKIKSFGRLPAGWHYGQGIAPSSQLIEGVSSLNEVAYALGFTSTEAFPRICGGITLAIYEGCHEIEICVEKDGQVATFSHEADGREIKYLEDVPMSSILGLLTEAREKCWSYAQSTRSTTLASSSVLPVKPSRLPATVESLYSIVTAQMQTQKVCAIT